MKVKTKKIKINKEDGNEKGLPESRTQVRLDRQAYCKLTPVAGQALIEAVAAIGVIVVGVLGALGFLSFSVGYNRTVTNQYTATYLAAGLVEDYKNCLDVNGWDANCVSYMQGKGYFNSETVNNTRFTKNIATAEPPGGGYRRVAATVQWQDRGRSYDVQVEDRFYNWR